MLKYLHLLLFALCIISPILGQSTSPQSTQQEKRIALVIANGKYLNSTLANPENDARAMKIALQSVGFTVMEYENLNANPMKKAIDDFGARLKSYDVALFYYAGHGLQAKGYNYLIPVDAQLLSEQDVEYDCVQADRILGKMEGSGTKINIIILDACRNNPSERSWTRSATGRGLAFMNAPRGTLIAYSTSPGNTALDGSGENSPYTSAILESIQIPNITIIQMFQNVRSIVVNKTNKQQIPWESTSLEGDIYFLKTDDVTANQTVLGKITPLVRLGSLKLTTEISGNLFLDGKFLADIKANTTVPINNLPIGNHLLEIKGVEYWNSSIEIKEKDTVLITSKGKSVKAEANFSSPNQFEDFRDNSIYKMIKIGDKIWMAENMRYETPSGSLCYDNTPANCNIYGRFYNWETAINVCPAGWHLPTYKELIDFFRHYGTISGSKSDYEDDDTDYENVFGTPESTNYTYSNIISDKKINIKDLDAESHENIRTMMWSSSSVESGDRASAIYWRKSYKYVFISEYPKDLFGFCRCVKD